MSHVEAVALKSFLLGKQMKSKKSPPFPLSDREFKQLEARGLVAEAGAAQPPKGQAGAQSSASPAGQASQSKTANKSAAGGKTKGQAKPA